MYLKNLINVINNIDIKNINELNNDITKCVGTIYILGNGGSASIASHACNDLFKIKKKNARCLTDNIATFSAYSNDVSYDMCFVEQLKYLLTPNDLVICLSTSGNSMNILNAYKYSKDICKTRFIHGNKVNFDFTIPSNDTQIIEDIFQIIFHSVCK